VYDGRVDDWSNTTRATEAPGDILIVSGYADKAIPAGSIVSIDPVTYELRVVRATWWRRLWWRTPFAGSRA
jgi:hypothetical protein